MFFNEKELKVAENLAWKMLDSWNHEYCPNLNDYAHFYFKDRIIFDPWMNEKGQELPWPNHEDKKYAVKPVEYYGQDTIEYFVADMFMRRPEWAPDITEKIKNHLGSDGILMSKTTLMPIAVYIAMSEEQAKEEHGRICIGQELSDSKRIYFDMTKLPKELVTVVHDGWEMEVVFDKRNAKKVLNYLYPNGIKFDYKRLINRIKGNQVRLIGYGD